MEQHIIDDLSDLLQGRDGEHREYPYGHPKYRPPAGTALPCNPEATSTLTVKFDSSDECKKFFDIFVNLGKEAKERTLKHLEEFGTIRVGG